MSISLKNSIVKSFFLTVTGQLFLAALACGQNLIRNAGFEQGLSQWTWRVSGDAKATGRLDSTESRRGEHSFFLSNESDMRSQVYGHVFQNVRGLKPYTKYRVSAWFKGAGVGIGGNKGGGRAWIGGGGHRRRRWSLRKRLPKGDFDWNEFSIEFTTYEDETAFQLIVIVEGQTQKLWVDDVRLERVREPVRVHSSSVGKELIGGARVYPAFPESGTQQSPLLRIGDVEPGEAGGTLRISHSERGLHFFFDVRDTSPGLATPADRISEGDSVCIAIDTAPDTPKGGYDRNCYEIGLALNPEGTLNRYCRWRAGGRAHPEAIRGRVHRFRH